MSYFVFVDNSNVWIEGKYYSAVHKGNVDSIYNAHALSIQDNSWAIDFGKLLNEVTNSHVSDIKNAILFGSKPTNKDSLWNAMKKAGFTVHNIQRNVANKEKKVDTGIVAEILKVLYTKATPGDTFVLVMGDSDFVPVMNQITDYGVKAVVAFWDNVSGELKTTADEFISLNNVIDKITY